MTSGWRPRRTKAGAAAASVLAAAMMLGGCAGASPDGDGSAGALGGTVLADGSSTVEPLTKAARLLFEGVAPGVEVKITTTGTTAGFRSFCSGSTDISEASRPISDDEIAKCVDADVEFTEVVVANDGLSVIVNPENDWATDMTAEQLQAIWAPESEGKITNWNQVDPDFPDQPLVLFGPGGDSGTLDFFTAAINGEEDAIRADYSSSEDDNVTVAGVAKHLGGIGFLGLSYVNENEGKIVAASVNGVSPSVETVQDGTYTPLSRPLFIYVRNTSYADQPQVKAFVDFYVDNALDIATRAQVVPLTDKQITIAQEELASLE